MLFQGRTSEFSLPELFKFIQDSQQTGRLSLKPVAETDLEVKPHFFWFDQGNLVAASNRLDGLGLLTILQQRTLIKSGTLPHVLRQCPSRVALGTFLKDSDLLSGKQLKSLFVVQVLRHMRDPLQGPDVMFAFYPLYPLPYLEMTGVKIRATDITLPSLRMLKTWDALIDKLPSLESGLKLAQAYVPRHRLNTQEKEVLNLAEQGISLSKISVILDLPAIEVQKICFRLIFVGIVDEVPLVHFSRITSQPRKLPVQVSGNFLGKLSNYLKKKAEPFG